MTQTVTTFAIGDLVVTYSGAIGKVLDGPYIDYHNGEQLVTVEVDGHCFPHSIADLEPATVGDAQAELDKQWAKCDEFFAHGFVEGEDVYVHWFDAKAKAVYLCNRACKAGIAILRDGKPHLPHEVEYSRLSARLDD